MFEPQQWSEDGTRIDPRDVPVAPVAAFWRSNRDRLAAVFNARVEALGESNQLDLATEAASCKAVLDWTLCKVASSFVIKDAASPLVLQAMERSGGIGLIQLGGPETPGVSEGAVPELALALSCSEYAARDYIAVGLDLRFRLRCTNNELGGGRITFAHARVISEATRTLSVDAAERLDARLADAAHTRPPGRLRVLARRLVAKADPAALRERHAAAMADRSASAFDIGDGIGAFSLSHQLDVIAAIDTELDGWARRRRLADPGTSFVAHRADAAAFLLLGRDPVTGIGSADRHHGIAGRPTQLGTTQASMGQSSTAQSTTAQSTTAQSTTAQSSTAQSSTAQSSTAQSSTAQSTTAQSTTAQSTTAQSTTAQSTTGMRGAKDAERAEGWPRGVSAPSGVDLPQLHTELRVTMSADTLLGLDDDTCELEGWGPITAAQARRLAQRSSSTILRRVFIDPVDDAIMILDAGTYRFTRGQILASQTLHPISCFPGATTPATRCQTDHRIPYRTGPPGQPDPPGQTMVGNAQPLGIRHHRIRTHLGWTASARPDDPHTIVWVTQHGKQYTVSDHAGA